MVWADMPPIALLLAQAASSSADKTDSAFSPQNPAFLVGVVGVILSVFYAVDKIDAFAQRRKRQPSLDVDLVSLQSAITTLTASVADLKAAKDSHNGHKERIAALEARCAEQRAQCEDLKGQLEREIASQRSFQAKNTREIFERIEADAKDLRTSIATLGTTINKEFNTLYRALGKVEGVTLDERG